MLEPLATQERTPPMVHRPLTAAFDVVRAAADTALTALPAR